MAGTAGQGVALFYGDFVTNFLFAVLLCGAGLTVLSYTLFAVLALPMFALSAVDLYEYYKRDIKYKKDNRDGQMGWKGVVLKG